MHQIRKVLSTREGTFAFATLAGLLAIGLLLAFMAAYRNSVDEGAQPVTVLVARDSLPKGVGGDMIAEKGLFKATGFKRDQVKQGAVTDPASLRGQVAVHDLVKGQQLTVADFSRPTNPVLSRLAGDQRAVTIPVDSAHGMAGQSRPAITSTSSPASRSSRRAPAAGRARSCGSCCRTSRCSRRRPRRRRVGSGVSRRRRAWCSA